MQKKEWYPVKLLIGSSTISYDGLYEINRNGQVRLVEDIRKVNGSYWKVKGRIINTRVDFKGIAFAVFKKEYEFRAIAITNILYAVFGKGVKERIKIELPEGDMKELYYNQLGENSKPNMSKINSRAIVQRDLYGRFVYKYNSISDAVKAGFVRSSIHKCCNYEASHHRGFKWQYADVDSDGDLADF